MSRTSPLAPDPLAALHDTLPRSRPHLPDLHRTATILRDEPDRLRTSLSFLQSSGDVLSQVAERSYTHPNGFAKIVLHGDEYYGIRLHVWHREAGRWMSDTNPHGHRWEFASWIVAGELRETIFAEADGDSGIRHDRCTYNRDRAGAGILEPDGRATLHIIGRNRRPAGTVYQRDRNVVHTVTPAGYADLVASLVLQGPRSFRPTPVYLPRGETPEQLGALLGEVAAAVDLGRPNS